MNERRRAVIVFIIPLVLYCDLSVSVNVESETDTSNTASTLIWFQERESGTESYSVRMIVDTHYLRIDDGEESSGFVLFDRVRKAIYSVDHDNRSVLVLSSEEVKRDKPGKFDLAEQEVSSHGSPPIGGHRVKIHRLYTNGQLCFEVAAAAGLLEGAVYALREFHHALAAEHAIMMQHTPQELASDCDLSDLVFAPDRHLQFGFPVWQRDYNGKLRELRDYDADYPTDPRLFDLPKGYRRVTTVGLRR